MTIRIEQQVAQKGNEWWEWSVWLEGSMKELDAIKQVTYTLHPTFPTPVVKVTNRKTGFRLNSSGWGEFMIYLKIQTKDGRVKHCQHYLRLTPSAPKKTQGESEAVAEPVTKGAPRATVFVSGGTRDIDTVDAVRNVLSQHDIKVVNAQDLQPGQQWQKGLKAVISDSAAAIFVISGRTNLWMNEEIKAAVNTGVRHIIPLVVGPNVDLPEALRGFQAVHAESPLAIEDMANTILSQSLKKPM